MVKISLVNAFERSGSASITSRYISRALDSLGTSDGAPPGADASLLQRVLAAHDARTAHILAIDLFLVGIDTVRSRSLRSTARATPTTQLNKNEDLLPHVER